ncbi:MAG: hypothetical protein L0G99_09985, partial [Propionibacteriales bacterium]|nr:hypothetical protein [Propionibacteriales bacterium]
STGSTSSGPAAAKKPSDAVKGYLDALAAGDAATALSYAESSPADTTMLTNEALAASNKLGAIAEINVPEVTDEYAYQVAASYKMGTRTVNKEINVTKVGEDWKLTDVAGTLTLDLGDDLPITVNGVKVEAKKIIVFPGTYVFDTGNKYVGFDDKGTVSVDAPGAYESGPYQATLNKTGKQAAIKAAQDSLNACLKQQVLAPKGCMFKAYETNGVKVDTKTIRWSSTEKNPWARVEPSYEGLSQISLYPNGSAKLQAQGTQRGAKGSVETMVRIGTATVDLSGDKPVVTWSN